MKLIAHTNNGLNLPQIIDITNISTWMNREVNHSIHQLSIASLLADAVDSKRMQVYCSGQFKGRLDAHSGTPLYTNGQESVSRLELDGKLIWGNHKVMKMLSNAKSPSLQKVNSLSL